MKNKSLKDKVKMKQDSTELHYFNCSPRQTMTDVLCKPLFMSFLYFHIFVLISSSLRRLRL